MEDSPANRAGSPQKTAPSPLDQFIWPALKVGVIAGTVGAFGGAIGGVIRRTRNPVLFSAAAGIQCFTLGSTFFGSREFLLATRGRGELTSNEKTSATAIAGSIAGTAGAILRGSGNILPGIIVFGTLGAIGQALDNTIDKSKAENRSKTSWLESKWSPIKPLTDSDYKHMLEEQLLAVDAQISLVDKKIQALKNEERQSLVAKVENNELKSLSK